MNNLLEVLPRRATESGVATAFGLLKSGKLTLRHTSDRGDLIKISWKMIRKVRPGHEENRLDGTAQSVRNEETPRDRSGRPDIDSQEEARPQQFVIGNDEAELELSVESRSFVNRVNDQVRKRQKRISNVTEYWEKHSMIWEMFMAVTMELAVFMGKNYQNNCHSIVNTTDLTLKQMFDISTKLVSEQDEISRLDTIGWEHHSWKYLSLIGDERIINLQRTKVYVFSDSVLCLGKIFENPPIERCMGTKIGMVKIFFKITETSTESTASQWNSSGIFSQDSIRCSSVKKSNVYCSDWEKHQTISQEEFSLCQCSTTFPVEQKTMNKNVWHALELYLCMQGSLVQDNGHSMSSRF